MLRLQYIFCINVYNNDCKHESNDTNTYSIANNRSNDFDYPC